MRRKIAGAGVSQAHMRAMEDAVPVVDKVNALPPMPALTIQYYPRQLSGAHHHQDGPWCSAMGSGIEMLKSGTARARGHAARHHDRGLLTIGLFKVAEAVLFFLVGVGVIHYVHRDLGDAVLRLAERLRVDPDGRIVTWLLDHLDAVTSHRMKQIGVATFFYAGLRLAEGAGLVLEKVWAEYLTVFVTVAFLPWELYEFIRRPDWVRICLLIANLAVLTYLVWWLRRAKVLRKLA